MRELKFRVYIEKTGEMLTDVGLLPNDHESINTISSEGFYFNPKFIEEHPDGFHLMQYTGIKDKNGKEIYEGDIITNTNYVRCGCPNCDEKRHKDSSGGLITFNNGVFGYESKKFGEVFTMNNPKDWEILGDKYENPELLEADTHD